MYMFKLFTLTILLVLLVLTHIIQYDMSAYKSVDICETYFQNLEARAGLVQNIIIQLLSTEPGDIFV